MRLSQMLILESPVVSEKSARIASDSAYVFKVRTDANKPEIKKAVEALYQVHVRKVNIVKIPPKEVHVRRVKGWRKGYKKAMVTLAHGETIEQV
ncbi:MAG: 50S ribosomal protein L23 [Candidatus Ryanbacteria bacterium RIFCSPHIGHO2_02_FULL_48_12]|uniref:Large ribosomal subunit protein uL23 n=1 Tax=Candidatus Ryanbacteria bacterium RIFCSPHIGHO2_01_FULL_48_27 TaxID=1802115 RepID=A0A1G2G437_9BACT|nr:MAG: 50S ribosomal protein L23 [Candidatus Ryanbacteria bacterium RIFCSPHIGHO2_01_FULL_48_27]OGZ50783.1 MAG: 50S ribosomal protein L23 [Candidatus Ryanbacteria bacterium RIFCSPHIGHO2_02_FULL_48_12]